MMEDKKQNPYTVGAISAEELDQQARKGLDLLGKLCSGTASENESKAAGATLKAVSEATRRINSKTRDGELRLRAAKAAGATPEEVRPIFRQIAGVASTIILFLILAAPLAAQSGKSVRLNWTDPQEGVEWSIQRADKACGDAADADFATLNATLLTEREYLDANVPFGRFCYRAFAHAGGLTSAPSDTAQADVAPAAPSTPTITVEVAMRVRPDGTMTARVRINGREVREN